MSTDNSRKSESRSNDSKKIQCENSQMDSGFMSGSNLLSSTSLCSEGSLSYDKDSTEDRSGDTKLETQAVTSDYLDSGIDLSERISSLNLTSGPISETDPVQLDSHAGLAPTQQQPETRSKLEQLGLSPVHITILKEIFKKDDDGDTQLHVAVMKGFFEVVWHITRLLPHQALLDIPNNSGRTALHLAVASGNSNLARHLIICGASPVARNQKGDTPLHGACRSSDISMVYGLTGQVTSHEVLQARLSYPPNHTPGLLAADLNNYDGQTCIHIAAQGSRKEILQHLTWYGADINAKECKCGRTALHFAVESRDPELIRFLTETCRSALSIQNYSGLTPYQLAVANDAPTLATLLEELGAKKENLPYTYSAEDDLDYEDDLTSFEGEDTSWSVNDLQISGMSLPYTSPVVVPVTSHGAFNADQYL